MAAFEFKLPDIGEGVTEGEVVAWHVAAGDVVREDDLMVEVMTDKATVTIGAPKAGTIAEIRVAVGTVAKVGEVLVVIETQGATASATPAAASKTTGESGPAATAVGDIREGLPGSGYFSRSAAAGPAGGNGAGPAEALQVQGAWFVDKPLATPATRKLARDLEVDLRKVRPSGPSGRVTKDDVRTHAGGAPTAPHTKSAVVPAAAPRPAVRIVTPAQGGPLEERRPFVGIRRKIAERMQTSKNTAAHFTFVEECDAGRLMELRDRARATAEERGVRLSFLPFIVKAVSKALERHPMLNSTLDESTNELVLRRSYHVGIATATDQGLMVPVLRDVDRRSVLDIAVEIERLSEGARTGRLTPQELTGSTFTITSLGRQGGLFATPILNFPEVGILGVHQIKERPVVRDGQIVVGHVMLLSLSFDHRIVDGHVGAAFAYEVIGFLEKPERLFLEMV